MSVPIVFLTDSVLGRVEVSESEHLLSLKNKSHVEGVGDYKDMAERKVSFKFEAEVTSRLFSISVSGWFAEEGVPAAVVRMLRQKFDSQSSLLFVLSVGINDLR